MVSDVSRTAIGVARLRAVESQRPDRLFDDPYASAFVPGFTADSAPDSAPDSATSSVFRVHVAVRTRFYDDYLRTAGCAQVVLVAAGLDTRAFRLSWPPGVRLFEMDLPELLAYKEEVLTARNAEARCSRAVVGVDLREDWPSALLSAGFDPAVPTAWLVEGLLVYLSAEDATSLLTRITDLSAPSSRISCEHRATERNRSREPMSAGMRHLTSMWQGGLGTQTATWLAGHGWHIDIHNGQELAESYGRAEPGFRVSSFLTGTR
jgi:methyltransferase (TIGR00027 family)